MADMRIGGVRVSPKNKVHPLPDSVAENLTKDPGGISAKDTMLRMSWLTGTRDADWAGRDARDRSRPPGAEHDYDTIAMLRFKFDRINRRPPTKEELIKYVRDQLGDSASDIIKLIK